jgi:hypothetical protein
MKTLGKIGAEKGGKPDVVSASPDYAGVPSVGRESDDNNKPFPDEMWKSASQIEVDGFLAGWLGKNSPKAPKNK